MRPCPVEICDIRIEHAVELLLLQDEQVIEALTSHISQEALTDGIGPRGVNWRFENLDTTRLGNSIEGHAKLAIVITDEILRSHAIGSSFSKLLCRPSVGGRTCHADMDHSPRVQLDDEEGKQRTEEEISDGEKVTRPDLLG